MINNKDIRNTKRGLVIRITKPTNDATFFGTMCMCISAGLPYIDSLPSYVRWGLPIIGLLLFFLGNSRNTKFLMEAFAILSIAAIVNLYAYYQAYGAIYSFNGFFVRSMECWVFIIMALYYLNNSDDSAKKYISYLIVLLAIITCVTSLMVLPRYPNAIRSLGNGGKGFETGLAQYLYAHNVSTWGLCYAICFLIPSLSANYRKTGKKIVLLIIALFEILVVFSQVTFAIIISLVFIAFVFIRPIKPKHMIWGAIGIICVFIFLNSYLADILLFVSDVLSRRGSLSTLSKRVYQMYMTLNGYRAYGDVEARFDLYSISINTFLRHPIFGMHDTSGQRYVNIGFHSQIFDMLASIGVVGFVPIAVMFITKVKSIYLSFKTENEKNYYFIGICMLVVLMLMNPVYYSPSIFMTTILFPVLLYDISKSAT